MSEPTAAGKGVVKKTTKAEGTVIEHPEEVEQVVDPKPVVVPCQVGMRAERTINVGDYNSVKIAVWLSVTVEPHEIDDAYDAVGTWVSEKFEETVGQVCAAYGIEA